MHRSKGDMASPKCLFFIIALHFAISHAGPLGPLPNVTSMDLGLKEGSCALGDVVYMSGDEFPGASACERCACSGGEVQCEKQRCEPRPGCKAVHRPDHCCPTYQCECEQEGRVYGNGEKLVDPQDPCRVCYCQGGEVVCRRIACFVRDDCQPRLVPGRCCPEYDNCPLRGVTSVHGMTPSVSSTPAVEVNTSADSIPIEPTVPKITIKEITPVSEIPVVTDVKIKEILPSPHNMDVAEYSSSKSPLIPREVTSEKITGDLKTESPFNESSDSKTSLEDNANEKGSDSHPSRISFSTQDSLNSEIYPSNVPNLILMGAPSQPISLSPLTTKAPLIEEEDQSLFDHNPAFPPIPDDLTVVGNHDDEILQEQNLDNDHVSMHDVLTSNDKILTEAPIIKESPSTMLYVTNGMTISTENVSEQELTSAGISTKNDLSSTESSTSKENSMINLRSVLPTQILNIPSFIADETTDDMESTTDIPTTESAEDLKATDDTLISSDKGAVILGDEEDGQSSFKEPRADIITPQTTENMLESKGSLILTTDVSAENKPSSLLIETSDQNPHEVTDKSSNDKLSSSTANPQTFDATPDSLSRIEPGSDTSLENIETTEFILSSFGSQESATDAVELIKIAPDNEKNSAIVEPPRARKNNVLNDLINLVGDVALISDHTDSPDSHHGISSTTISDSEELIPVNAGYKSKNNNWNLNSITEVPFKSKSQPSVNKQKNVEIEDDETDSITDSPPPNDKVEPTTKRPTIDNVSDNAPQNNNSTIDKKDIEIIKKTYVPTINKHPTKVVMENSNDQPSSDAATSGSEDKSPSSNDDTAVPGDTTLDEQDEASSPADEEVTEQSLDTSSVAP
ncbi:uncharacterized protein LOC119834950 [Zerene cesonia]|uniref:uncharacterized protein LOC119834950 n=1 Tax=Zerene cesonia TaxID=33412 RepID=UPI0018E535D5|nr:uncharacterized protein LOC119834950 [Zerene cesonia]